MEREGNQTVGLQHVEDEEIGIRVVAKGVQTMDIGLKIIR